MITFRIPVPLFSLISLLPLLPLVALGLLPSYQSYLLLYTLRLYSTSSSVLRHRPIGIALRYGTDIHSYSSQYRELSSTRRATAGGRSLIIHSACSARLPASAHHGSARPRAAESLIERSRVGRQPGFRENNLMVPYCTHTCIACFCFSKFVCATVLCVTNGSILIAGITHDSYVSCLPAQPSRGEAPQVSAARTVYRR